MTPNFTGLVVAVLVFALLPAFLAGPLFLVLAKLGDGFRRPLLVALACLMLCSPAIAAPPRSTPQPPYVAGRPLWNIAVHWQGCRVERARKIEERWRAISLWRAGQALQGQK
jgi:hypothetical protein